MFITNLFTFYYFMNKIFCLIFTIALAACQDNSTSEALLEDPVDRPNILWLVTEDMGPYIPPFGDSTVQTPNLSRLAAEGIRFTNVFSPSGVCAPSRSAIATGMYPSSIGANNMRAHSYTEVTGLPAYEAVPPPQVKMFSELLRKHGYYCTNNKKTDYQFQAPITAWDENGPYAHWRHNENKDQPFFSIFNFTETHESGLFEPYGFRREEQRFYHAGDTSFQWEGGRMKESETTVYLPKDTEFDIPPYLPNNEITKRDMWKMYNNIAEMDRQVGMVLAQLEEDGLLANTVIFFYGDHGGPLPRQKRLIYDAGLKVPLIVRFPDKKDAGSIDDQLISFIDLAPTVLRLASAKVPGYLQGRAFLSSDTPERKYIHAAGDRFDGFTDAIRAVRDDRFKYIRNYRPEQAYYLPVTFRERIPTMKELLRMRDANELDEVQALWFQSGKPKEELYDCLNDPHEVNNLAAAPDHAEKLAELRRELNRWIAEIGDQPNLPERELISQLWNGADTKPSTANPQVSIRGEKVYITCDTEGASIGYRLISSKNRDNAWSVYQAPFEIPVNTQVEIQAHRLGYHPSEVVVFTL